MKTIKRLKLQTVTVFYKGKTHKLEVVSPENTLRKKVNELIDRANLPKI